MTELWLPVPEFEGLYEVSDHGRIYSHERFVKQGEGRMSLRRGRILKPKSCQPSGRLVVTLCKNGSKRAYKVHRLVAAAFIGAPPPGADVLHEDDNPQNNHVSNLRYGYDIDNALDRRRNGREHNTNKTQCIRGHAYTTENTYIVPKTGHRQCRECNRIRSVA